MSQCTVVAIHAVVIMGEASGHSVSHEEKDAFSLLERKFYLTQFWFASCHCVGPRAYALCGRHSPLAPVLSSFWSDGRSSEEAEGRSDGLSDGPSHVFKRRSREQGIPWFVLTRDLRSRATSTCAMVPNLYHWEGRERRASIRISFSVSFRQGM